MISDEIFIQFAALLSPPSFLLIILRPPFFANQIAALQTEISLFLPAAVHSAELKAR